MTRQDSTVSDGYFYVIHIHLWQILIVLGLAIGLIYLLRKYRARRY